MAKIKLTGHASGSGVITVTAPNTSTDRVITLPDSTSTIATTAQLPTVSSTAPSSPAEGDQWFNTSASSASGISSKAMAVYNGTAWQKSITGIPFTATGGTITTSGSYTIHTFTSSGTFTPAIAGTVDYLVVAGGGGGGFEVGGAGGAGGFRTAAGFSVAATGLTVTVGAGGTGRTSDGVPPTGADSVFSSITSLGGGGAGSAVNPAPANNINGGNGGSGGSGAGRTGATAGTGTAGQGNNAGATVGNYNWSLVAEGGGGGAGAVGVAGTISPYKGGNGGAGLSSSYSGSAVTYAGGGGGGSYQGAIGSGGAGGGGNGASTNGHSGVAATANTGGGGGGGGAGGTAGGNGGSGIVIIRYLT